MQEYMFIAKNSRFIQTQIPLHSNFSFKQSIENDSFKHDGDDGVEIRARIAHKFSNHKKTIFLQGLLGIFRLYSD
jgi:hypothetical protein